MGDLQFTQLFNQFGAWGRFQKEDAAFFHRCQFRCHFFWEWRFGIKIKGSNVPPVGPSQVIVNRTVGVVNDRLVVDFGECLVDLLQLVEKRADILLALLFATKPLLHQSLTNGFKLLASRLGVNPGVAVHDTM